MNVGKRVRMAMVFALAAAVAQAGVTVTNVVIQQRYPWNGLVDINYDVLSDDTNLEARIYPTGYDRQNGKYVLMSTLSGDGAGAKVKAGTYHMIWNMTKDAPTLVSTNFSVNLEAVSGMAPYLVIDLSGGPDAACYPVEHLNAIPSNGWTDEFKTSKLVLRLIMPDTFIMGSPEEELGRQSDEIQHQVTLTQPYYIGVFEVTQKQWSLVIGGVNPSRYTGDMRPVEEVSYNDVRGNNLGNKWPVTNLVDSTSFVGKLRVKTGVTFDLPTEAQWEYACRAGTTTSLNSGKNLTGTGTCSNLATIGRYNGDESDGKGGYSQHTKVGVYVPNAWGLYDMHGNVWEWCLDWYGDYAAGSATDPKGFSTGSSRVRRGGGWIDFVWNFGNGNRNSSECRSAGRFKSSAGERGYYYYLSNSNGTTKYDYGYGFRLACILTMQ